MKKKSKKNFLDSLSFDDILDGTTLEIDASLTGKNLFLRHFSHEDLFKIFRKVGLFQHLKQMGFTQLITDIKFDALVHHLKLYNHDKKHYNLLFDLRISERRFAPDKKYFKKGETPQIYDMIAIEWLSAQNPKANFSEGRPQLPGQKKPGLGILRYCFKMMTVLAKQVHKDGYMDIPEHVHGAIMYGKKFKFFDPSHEGVLHALRRDLIDYSLSDISWGIMTKTIIEQYKQKPQQYKPSEQIYAVSHRLKKYFNSSHYQHIYKKYFRRKRFVFNYEQMVKKRTAILKTKKIVDL